MEIELTEGDLAHIPSGISLLDTNIEFPHKYKTLQKPCVAVFLGPINSSHSKIYIDGEYWAVPTEYVYLYKRRIND